MLVAVQGLDVHHGIRVRGVEPPREHPLEQMPPHVVAEQRQRLADRADEGRGLALVVASRAGEEDVVRLAGVVREVRVKLELGLGVAPDKGWASGVGHSSWRTVMERRFP